MSDENKQSLMLLRFAGTDTYIVVPGVNFDPNEPDGNTYWVEEHTCPCNLTRFPVLEVGKAGLNSDPHGILEFVQEVQAPESWGFSGPEGDNKDDAYLILFSELRRLVDEKTGKIPAVSERDDIKPWWQTDTTARMTARAEDIKAISGKDPALFRFPFEWMDAEQSLRKDFIHRISAIVTGDAEDHLFINLTRNEDLKLITIDVAPKDDIGLGLVRKINESFGKTTRSADASQSSA